MASSNLKAFLSKLDAELQKDSEDYRTLVGNKKIHVFTYKSSTIRFTLRDLLNRSTGSDVQGREAMRALRPKLAKLITKLTKNIREDFFKLAARSNGTVEVKLIRGGVSATVLQTEKGRNNYGLIARTYKKSLDSFYEEFLKLLDKPITRPSSRGGRREISTAGEAFNLEHIQGSNIEHALNDAVHSALVKTYGDSTVPPELKKELNKFGVGALLEIYKDADNGIVNVTIRSQILNAIAGGGAEKDLAKKLRKAIQKLDIPNLPGSDSLIQAQRKKAVKAVVTPFKNKNTLKVKHEDVKIKQGKGKQSLRKKPKISALKDTSPALIRKKRIKSAQDSSEKRSMFSVMAMINQKLPQTVEKNMRSPALENRSGRFARSVRLTDVSTTRQGFPSFGYTYEKDPYQVFEMGRGKRPWSTPERDPRMVIDASIREIAAEMAIGRFYTRRV